MDKFESVLYNSHPIKIDWERFKSSVEFKTHRLLHSEEAIYSGFRDGWLYGRERKLKVKI